MPVIHKYANSLGYYIRGKIDGKFVTYQVTPSARKVMKKFGYDEGSTISWSFCNRLAEKRYLYTHGMEEPSNTLSGDEQRLGAKEEDALRELDKSIDTSQEHSDETSVEIPDDIERFINEWSCDKKVIGELTEVLSGRSNSEKWFASIRSFNDVNIYFTFQIRQNRLTYNFSEPIDYRVKDLRPVGVSNDFFVSIQPDKTPEFLIQIKNGGLEQLTIDTENPTQEDVDSLVLILPYIFDILKNLPDYKLDVGNWHFKDGKRVKLSRSQTAAIGETLQELAEEDGLKEGAGTGTISSKGYGGHGRILVDDVEATIPFTPRDKIDGPVYTGDRVQFRIQYINYSAHAKEIELV